MCLRRNQMVAFYVIIILCTAGLAIRDAFSPAPENPSGMAGYVYNVVTDPGYRRRGYSRGCMRELLTWFRQRGVTSGWRFEGSVVEEGAGHFSAKQRKVDIAAAHDNGSLPSRLNRTGQ